MDTPPERRCAMCGKSKPLGEFGTSLHSNGKRYPRSYCKLCRSQYARKYQADPANAQRIAQVQFLRRLRRHGLTEKRFKGLLAQQGGGCALCLDPLGNSLSSRLAIDHDHLCCPGTYSCGQCVRGLLCSSCNLGLGAFRDRPELLEAAARYLRQKES